MKYLKTYENLVRLPVTDNISKSLFPKNIDIETSNGEFSLEISDFVVSLPKVYVSYYHNTPEKTGDVLSDGEPDYLCIDLNFMRQGTQLEINVELTYGDAMMFEFKIHRGGVDVFHYNGFGSKFDSNYKFFLTEKSIEDLLKIFNRFGFNLKRNDFNFLDSDINSYDVKKNGGHNPQP